MDWNPKTPLQWDWENLALFTGKEIEIAKPAHQPEWRVEGGGGIGKGSMHSSVGGACSGSDLGNGSSRSSISASIDSSSKTGTKVSEFNFETAERFPKNPGKSNELTRVEDTGTSPAALASAGPREPLIGLKLGKRTYFEDATAANSMKNSSSSASATQPTALAKKSRVPQQTAQSSYCQVEDCNIDLSTAKDYHRKHRVCENHAKSPKVIVAGQERRFCQQCSRFHDLSEFDQKKRSCRRRLSDHNARRRKPQPEAISFNSSRLSTSFYDRQQMNLFFSRSPFGHMRTTASSSWESSGGFKLTQPKGSWVNSTKIAGIEGQLHFPSIVPSSIHPTPHHDVDKLLSFKSSNAEALNQGLEASMASHLDGAPDLRRALSLLSTDSWGSTNPGPTSHVQFASTNHTPAANPPVHAINSNPGFWQDEQPLAQQTRVLSFDLHSNGSQFEEFQLHKAPFEATFFDSSQIH